VQVTHLGIDISEHNAGLTIPTDGRVQFVLARASLAETHQDTCYHEFRDQCRAANIPFAAYHFVYPPLPGSGYAEQARNFHDVVRDTTVPVMVDVETDQAIQPSLADALGVHRAIGALGYDIPLLYLPHWYWSGWLGSPALPGELGQLMSSNYGSNTPNTLDDGYRSRGGDDGVGWAGYGGLEVAIWQFTSTAIVGGRSIDGGACKSDLSAFFKMWRRPVPGSILGGDMFELIRVIDPDSGLYAWNANGLWYHVPNATYQHSLEQSPLCLGFREVGQTQFNVYKAVAAASRRI
jgi:lysozyme